MTGPYLCLCQILSKRWKPFRSYGAHNNSTKQFVQRRVILLVYGIYPIFVNISVWKLWSAQGFGFTGHKYITKKVRVVSLVSDTHKRQMTLLSGMVRVPLSVKEAQRTAEV